jgi:hypothetical protein
MMKQSGKSGDIPMLFILWLITFTMLFASMSRASGAPVFEVEAICRTAIASIKGAAEMLTHGVLYSDHVCCRGIPARRYHYAPAGGGNCVTK